MQSIKVVIPSRERANWLAKRTTSTLKYTTHLRPTLFVRSDDSQLERYKTLALEYNAHLELQDVEGCFGVSQAYDQIINRAIEEGYTYLIILDDDMHFKMPNDGKPMYKRCNHDELERQLTLFAHSSCSEMPAGCLLPIMRRSLSTKGVLSFGAPLMWCYNFYLPHFSAHTEHRFYKGREIEAHCDLNLALQLLTNGYLTYYYTQLLIPCDRDNPGGCSTYRTAKVRAESVDYIIKKYSSQFVKPYIDSIGTHSVSVSYKRAFNEKAFCNNFDYTRVQDFCNARLRKMTMLYEEAFDVSS